jgi:hypothetical protein
MELVCFAQIALTMEGGEDEYDLNVQERSSALAWECPNCEGSESHE